MSSRAVDKGESDAGYVSLGGVGWCCSAADAEMAATRAITVANVDFILMVGCCCLRRRIKDILVIIEQRTFE